MSVACRAKSARNGPTVMAGAPRRSQISPGAAKTMVPKVGFEPTLPFRNRILSPARLPVPPLRPGGARSATGVSVRRGGGRGHPLVAATARLHGFWHARAEPGSCCQCARKLVRRPRVLGRGRGALAEYPAYAWAGPTRRRPSGRCSATCCDPSRGGWRRRWPRSARRRGRCCSSGTGSRRPSTCRGSTGRGRGTDRRLPRPDAAA